MAVPDDIGIRLVIVSVVLFIISMAAYYTATSSRLGPTLQVILLGSWEPQGASLLPSLSS